MRTDLRKELISLAKAGQRRNVAQASPAARNWIADNATAFETLCKTARTYRAKSCRKCGLPVHHCLCSYLASIGADGQSDSDASPTFGQGWVN